jgi:hypothetical protein
MFVAEDGHEPIRLVRIVKAMLVAGAEPRQAILLAESRHRGDAPEASLPGHRRGEA